MGNLDLGTIGITFLVFLLSTAFHEAAHAWMAWKWGDPTAKDLGRLTLSPFPHIDPFGTVLIPLLVLFQTGGNGIMGWASTPVDKSRMRDPRWGDLWTSAAGPLANLALIIICMTLYKIVFGTSLGTQLGDWQEAVRMLLWTGTWLNIFLMVINLLPIPPLDGSHIVANLLPDSLAEAYESIRPFGLFILIAVSFMGLINKLVDPLTSFAAQLLRQ